MNCSDVEKNEPQYFLFEKQASNGFQVNCIYNSNFKMK